MHFYANEYLLLNETSRNIIRRYGIASEIICKNIKLRSLVINITACTTQEYDIKHKMVYLFRKTLKLLTYMISFRNIMIFYSQ